jgi:hypothetical protein
MLPISTAFAGEAGLARFTLLALGGLPSVLPLGRRVLPGGCR